MNSNQLPRAVQLLNKTNQFNMATKRYTEEEYWEFSQASSNRVYTCYVSDKFGDAGLTGLISIRVNDDNAEIVDFVMSCRVMGKHIEDAMLYSVLSGINTDALLSVKAVYRETQKNRPFYEFIRYKYKDQANYILELNSVNKPNHITIVQGGEGQ
ncbi:hypothetical protein D3C74_334680 [compost metagenome]